MLRLDGRLMLRLTWLAIWIRGQLASLLEGATSYDARSSGAGAPNHRRSAWERCPGSVPMFRGLHMGEFSGGWRVRSDT